MAKQSRLEHEGIKTRNEQIANGNLDYWKGSDSEYGVTHPDALSDGDAQGKGSGIAMGYSTLNPENYMDVDYSNAGINYSNLVTNTDVHPVGGDYDYNGRPKDGVIGGRTYLSTINYYNKTNPYGLDSVDTTLNDNEGQYQFWVS